MQELIEDRVEEEISEKEMEMQIDIEEKGVELAQEAEERTKKVQELCDKQQVCSTRVHSFVVS